MMAYIPQLISRLSIKLNQSKPTENNDLVITVIITVTILPIDPY